MFVTTPTPVPIASLLATSVTPCLTTPDTAPVLARVFAALADLPNIPPTANSPMLLAYSPILVSVS